MHSTRLKQLMLTQLDTAAMRGPVNRSALAAQVYAMVRDSKEFWSLADMREALESHIRNGFEAMMREKMSEDYLRTHLADVPRRYLHLLEKLDRFICINAGAGLHVLAVNATREQWAISAKMKRAISDHVKQKADTDEDVYRALVAEGVDSIAELGMKKAA